MPAPFADQGAGKSHSITGSKNGSFGVPDPYILTGRELDHLGESNFFGGVRGKVTETTVTSTGNVVEPVAGVRFLADTNGNGKRDILTMPMTRQFCCR